MLKELIAVEFSKYHILLKNIKLKGIISFKTVIWNFRNINKDK